MDDETISKIIDNLPEAFGKELIRDAVRRCIKDLDKMIMPVVKDTLLQVLKEKATNQITKDHNDEITNRVREAVAHVMKKEKA